MYELINEKFIEIKEYKGQRVVTFRDIDTLHQRPDGTASRNFRKNRKHFIDGEDLFMVNQPDEIRRLGITRPQGGTPEEVILITETGYLMLVKSFRDELSWKVQRQLVNSYFRAKQLKHNDCSGIDQKAIIMAVKELYEKNYELYEKNCELNKKINKLNDQNYEFVKVIKILCEKVYEMNEKQSRKSSKHKKRKLI
ncbi:MAG: ORF6N domain-containing protein [Ruminococcus sp.]|nr:ORF6N domain-containing protein [Ruminococcus sp.]